jgi:hypothetical protein
MQSHQITKQNRKDGKIHQSNQINQQKKKGKIHENIHFSSQMIPKVEVSKAVPRI